MSNRKLPVTVQSYEDAADILWDMEQMRAREVALCLLAGCEDDAQSDESDPWHNFVPMPQELRLLADVLERH